MRMVSRTSRILPTACSEPRTQCLKDWLRLLSSPDQNRSADSLAKAGQLGLARIRSVSLHLKQAIDHLRWARSEAEIPIDHFAVQVDDRKMIDGDLRLTP